MPLEPEETAILGKPLPLGVVIPGQMISYYNPAAPEGRKALTLIFLQADANLATFQFANLPSQAAQKARDFWLKHEQKYAVKIDKRRTTDPMARLAKQLDRLSRLIGEDDAQDA